VNLLADVNVEWAVVRTLRADGHDVRWLAEGIIERRLKDPLVMEIAQPYRANSLTSSCFFIRRRARALANIGLSRHNGTTKTYAKGDYKLKSHGICEEKMYNDQALGTRPRSKEPISSSSKSLSSVPLGKLSRTIGRITSCP
jgi:hypothetical protein